MKSGSRRSIQEVDLTLQKGRSFKKSIQDRHSYSANERVKVRIHCVSVGTQSPRDVSKENMETVHQLATTGRKSRTITEDRNIRQLFVAQGLAKSLRSSVRCARA